MNLYHRNYGIIKPITYGHQWFWTNHQGIRYGMFTDRTGTFLNLPLSDVAIVNIDREYTHDV